MLSSLATRNQTSTTTSAVRKTRRCRFWQLAQGCSSGDACAFAHGDHELRRRPNLSKTSICEAWGKGCCQKAAEDCRYAHGVEDLQRRKTHASRLLPACTETAPVQRQHICSETTVFTAQAHPQTHGQEGRHQHAGHGAVANFTSFVPAQAHEEWSPAEQDLLRMVLPGNQLLSRQDVLALLRQSPLGQYQD